MSPKKSVFISLSPNVQKDDIRLTLKTLFTPWKWKKGEALANLEALFCKTFHAQHAFGLNSGRSSLMALLHAFRVKPGDEILIQAFTCSAVPGPIKWIGAHPIYVDVEPDTFGMDPHDIPSKITSKTKGIIIQHTFGIPSQIENIMDIAKQHKLWVIEDCAHSLLNRLRGKLLGTFGDAAFFSFGRDKVISSVYGGMVITNHPKVAERLRHFSEKIPLPSRYWILQQFLHPLLLSLILPLYHVFHIGKILLVLFQKIGVLSMAISKIEYHAGKPSYFPAKLPNGLAILALHQFEKITSFQTHRNKISEIYSQSLQSLRLVLPKFSSEYPLLRYPIITPHAHRILREAQSNKMMLGDWYTHVIAPLHCDLVSFDYKNGSCPVAQRLTEETLNLPTHINVSTEDANRIIQHIKDSYGNL